jgi:methanogenic corrinoid protein MtbC1
LTKTYIFDMTEKKTNSMKVVSLKTGLSAHVIRAWEKRYNAVTPARTETNHRLYSDQDIERLYLLKKATDAGHSIGRISGLSTGELHKLVSDIRIPLAPIKAADPENTTEPEIILKKCLEAINNMDGHLLNHHLQQASVSMSQPVMLDDLIVPLIHKIGDAWRDGTLRVVHEHLASYILRSFLAGMMSSYQVPEHAPKMVITTPSGHMHELGAMIAATTAAAHGWQVTYLGPNLPAEEIASAVIKNDAKVVCLSIVYPVNDPFTSGQLLAVKKHLGDRAVIIVGGRAASSYHQTIQNINARLVTDLQELRMIFESLMQNSRY